MNHPRVFLSDPEWERTVLPNRGLEGWKLGGESKLSWSHVYGRELRARG